MDQAAYIIPARRYCLNDERHAFYDKMRACLKQGRYAFSPRQYETPWEEVLGEAEAEEAREELIETFIRHAQQFKNLKPYQVYTYSLTDEWIVVLPHSKASNLNLLCRVVEKDNFLYFHSIKETAALLYLDYTLASFPLELNSFSQDRLYMSGWKDLLDVWGTNYLANAQMRFYAKLEAYSNKLKNGDVFIENERLRSLKLSTPTLQSYQDLWCTVVFTFENECSGKDMAAIARSMPSCLYLISLEKQQSQIVAQVGYKIGNLILP